MENAQLLAKVDEMYDRCMAAIANLRGTKIDGAAASLERTITEHYDDMLTILSKPRLNTVDMARKLDEMERAVGRIEVLSALK